MKRSTTKKILTALVCAFCCSLFIGAGFMKARAESGVANYETAFSTLALQNGAAVRYNNDELGGGFSYSLTMSKTQYESVKNNDAFENVTYGLLIGPEAYYQAHAFDEQSNIDKYYSLNTEQTGKAFLYDFSTKNLYMRTGDEENVYFRGSIVNIKDENLIRDYRAVGYVSYTFNGQEEKHFFTKTVSEIVRCPVEIAELAIATLDETKDADKIATLKTDYIDKATGVLDWSVTTTSDSAVSWRSGQWTSYAFANSGNATVPVINYAEKEKNNRWIESKYTTEYFLVRGDTKIPFVSGETDTMGLNGKYTLTGETTCSVNGVKTTSYTKDITFIAMDKTFPVINGADINYAAAVSANGFVKFPANKWSATSWDENEQAYVQPDPGTYNYIYAYAQKATGAFIADVSMKRTGDIMEEFRIYTGKSNFIAFRGRNGHLNTKKGFEIRTDNDWYNNGNGSYIYCNTKDETKYSNNYADGEWFKLRLVFFNGVLYAFGSTYNDGEYKTSESYTLLMSVSKTAVTAYDNSEILRHDEYVEAIKSSIATYYGKLLDAATNNEFAFAVRGLYGTGKTYFSFNLEDDDAKVAEFMTAYLN